MLGESEFILRITWWYAKNPNGVLGEEILKKTSVTKFGKAIIGATKEVAEAKKSRTGNPETFGKALDELEEQAKLLVKEIRKLQGTKRFKKDIDCELDATVEMLESKLADKTRELRKTYMPEAAKEARKRDAAKEVRKPGAAKQEEATDTYAMALGKALRLVRNRNRSFNFAAVFLQSEPSDDTLGKMRLAIHPVMGPKKLLQVLKKENGSNEGICGLAYGPDQYKTVFGGESPDKCLWLEVKTAKAGLQKRCEKHVKSVVPSLFTEVKVISARPGFDARLAMEEEDGAPEGLSGSAHLEKPPAKEAARPVAARERLGAGEQAGPRRKIPDILSKPHDMLDVLPEVEREKFASRFAGLSPLSESGGPELRKTAKREAQALSVQLYLAAQEALSTLPKAVELVRQCRNEMREEVEAKRAQVREVEKVVRKVNAGRKQQRQPEIASPVRRFDASLSRTAQEFLVTRFAEPAAEAKAIDALDATQLAERNGRYRELEILLANLRREFEVELRFPGDECEAILGMSQNLANAEAAERPGLVNELTNELEDLADQNANWDAYLGMVARIRKLISALDSSGGHEDLIEEVEEGLLATRSRVREMRLERLGLGITQDSIGLMNDLGALHAQLLKASADHKTALETAKTNGKAAIDDAQKQFDNLKGSSVDKSFKRNTVLKLFAGQIVSKDLRGRYAVELQAIKDLYESDTPGAVTLAARMAKELGEELATYSDPELARQVVEDMAGLLKECSYVTGKKPKQLRPKKTAELLKEYDALKTTLTSSGWKSSVRPVEALKRARDLKQKILGTGDTDTAGLKGRIEADLETLAGWKQDRDRWDSMARDIRKGLSAFIKSYSDTYGARVADARVREKLAEMKLGWPVWAADLTPAVLVEYAGIREFIGRPDMEDGDKVAEVSDFLQRHWNKVRDMAMMINAIAGGGTVNSPEYDVNGLFREVVMDRYDRFAAEKAGKEAWEAFDKYYERWKSAYKKLGSETDPNYETNKPLYDAIFEEAEAHHNMVRQDKTVGTASAARKMLEHLTRRLVRVADIRKPIGEVAGAWPHQRDIFRRRIEELARVADARIEQDGQFVPINDLAGTLTAPLDLLAQVSFTQALDIVTDVDADPGDRRKAREEALASLRFCLDHIQKDPLILHCAANPFGVTDMASGAFVTLRALEVDLMKAL